jgi:outer membrane protein OmpA-like peptidoglycan-associated protein
MKLTTRACILCLVLSGCSASGWRAPGSQARPQAVSNAQMKAADNSTETSAIGMAPAAAGASEHTYGYRLLERSRTGLASVFDDGKNTYLRFDELAPRDLMLFDERGQRVAFERYGAYVAIRGVHRGVLVRTYSARSYAAPADPERVARVIASREAEPAAAAALPPQFAAARAWIQEAQAQQRGLLLVPARNAGGSAAAPAPVKVSELDPIETRIAGQEARLVRVHFASGSAKLELSEGAKSALSAAALQSKSIQLRGRSDATGSPQLNARLARARAQSVRNLLIAAGVAPERLELSSTVGDYVAPNTTREGRASNRRVEIVLIGAGAGATDALHAARLNETMVVADAWFATAQAVLGTGDPRL